jgi:hypothetical protein
MGRKSCAPRKQPYGARASEIASPDRQPRNCCPSARALPSTCGVKVRKVENFQPGWRPALLAMGWQRTFLSRAPPESARRKSPHFRTHLRCKPQIGHREKNGRGLCKKNSGGTGMVCDRLTWAGPTNRFSLIRGSARAIRIGRLVTSHLPRCRQRTHVAVLLLFRLR